MSINSRKHRLQSRRPLSLNATFDQFSSGPTAARSGYQRLFPFPACLICYLSLKPNDSVMLKEVLPKMKSGIHPVKGAQLFSLMGCLIMIIGGFAAIGGFIAMIESGNTWLMLLG